MQVGEITHWPLRPCEGPRDHFDVLQGLTPNVARREDPAVQDDDAMPAGDELIKLLDDERAVLDELRGLWLRATDYGVLTRRVDADNAVLDDMRRWILGDLATEARCAPEAKAPSPPSFAQVHTGSIADHVSNWGDVRDTLRGTRYEKYLPQPIDPIIDPSNPRLPL